MARIMFLLLFAFTLAGCKPTTPPHDAKTTPFHEDNSRRTKKKSSQQEPRQALVAEMGTKHIYDAVDVLTVAKIEVTVKNGSSNRRRILVKRADEIRARQLLAEFAKKKGYKFDFEP